MLKNKCSCFPHHFKGSVVANPGGNIVFKYRLSQAVEALLNMTVKRLFNDKYFTYSSNPVTFAHVKLQH